MIVYCDTNDVNIDTDYESCGVPCGNPDCILNYESEGKSC